MAIATYDDLKSEISDWMDRTDISGKVETFITLAEAELNRKLQAVRLEAALATVAGSRLVDVTALSIDQPVALFLDIGASDIRLPVMEGAQSVREETPKRPQRWELDGGSIAFDAPSDAIYNLRFEYDARFALSDDVPTNDLLIHHPDLYLAACIVWGAGYAGDQGRGMDYAARLHMLLPSVRKHYADRRKTRLQVEPGLMMNARSQGRSQL